MKIIYLNPPDKAVELLDFEYSLPYEIVVVERENPEFNYKFYAYFENCEVKDGCLLIGEYGNGHTIDAALSQYASKIGGKKLVFNSYSTHRKEIDAPFLKHTKVIGK